MIQAICIAPSRELAIQILSVVERMGEYTPVECFHAGRDSVKKGMAKLTQQVIVGTPGTIIDVRPRSPRPGKLNRRLMVFILAIRWLSRRAFSTCRPSRCSC